MSYLTDYADLGVMLPLLLTVPLAFLVAGWRRAAVAWAIAVPATFAVILVAKMLVAACGPLLPLHGLHSPSGHTASAAVVFGGLLAMLLPPVPEQRRCDLRTILLASLLAALIGGTRLALHLHTRTDVAVGAAVGIAGAWLLVRLAGPRPPGLRMAVPLAAAFGLGLLLHGEHLRAEERIDRLSHRIWPLSLCDRQSAEW
jgi:membrane-associated phospholipid phosphatase